jgi:hypothetical protein
MSATVPSTSVDIRHLSKGRTPSFGRHRPCRRERQEVDDGAEDRPWLDDARYETALWLLGLADPPIEP